MLKPPGWGRVHQVIAVSFIPSKKPMSFLSVEWIGFAGQENTDHYIGTGISVLDITYKSPKKKGQ